MINIDHISPFVTDDASKLNIFTNTIGFSTFHKFRDNEQVIYLSDGQTGVAGLTTLMQNIMFLLLMLLI